MYARMLPSGKGGDAQNRAAFCEVHRWMSTTTNTNNPMAVARPTTVPAMALAGRPAAPFSRGCAVALATGGASDALPDVATEVVEEVGIRQYLLHKAASAPFQVTASGRAHEVPQCDRRARVGRQVGDSQGVRAGVDLRLAE